MNLEKLPPMIGFVVVMVGTPGPNNLMLMASGANAGFRRSVPHILGILAGCQAMLLALAVGLGPLMMRYPPAMTAMRVASAAFMVYLAWQLVRHRRHRARKNSDARPMTFGQAALFQWINPKAWMMNLSAVATFTDPAHFGASLTLLALCFLLLGAPLISSWNLFGVALQSWLHRGDRLARFNLAMAALLLASLYPTFVLH